MREKPKIGDIYRIVYNYPHKTDIIFIKIEKIIDRAERFYPDHKAYFGVTGKILHPSNMDNQTFFLFDEGKISSIKEMVIELL